MRHPLALIHEHKGRRRSSLRWCSRSAKGRDFREVLRPFHAPCADENHRARLLEQKRGGRRHVFLVEACTFELLLEASEQNQEPRFSLEFPVPARRLCLFSVSACVACG